MIQNNRVTLNVGDILVRGKGPFSKHFGVFAGRDVNGSLLVAENQAGYGVRYVTYDQFLNGKPLVRVERFEGSAWERQQVIPAINVLLGKEYDLINFNCEHFANYISRKQARSRQVENVGGIALAVGIFGLLGMMASSKD
jgi:hypothetical protein